MPNEVITCSHCARALKVPSDLLGRKVKCPACGKVFLAKATEAGLDVVEIVDEPDSPEPEVRASTRPRRRRRPDFDDYEDDLDEDDDEDWTPRPRRRRRSRKQAAAAVLGPAIGLIVVGAIGMLAAILMLVGQMARMQAPTPNVAAPENSVAYQAGGWAAVIFSGCWSLALLVGGFRMKDTESLRDARVAAIVAVIPCSLAWVLGLPLGIWALFVLARPEVKRGFRK